jgi:CBS domain-containing protein
MFSRLSMSCGEFLDHRVEGLLLPNLISASANTTVKELLNLFRQHRVHRIYVVSEGSKAPLGVCTLTDIMQLFSIPPPKGDPLKAQQS